jgi:GNAT superfamily N-acetyltransferase
VDTVHFYDSAREEASVYALYEECVGGLWPLPRDRFRSIVNYSRYHAGDALVAETAGRLSGFVASQLIETGSGSITLVLFRDEATGAALLHAAEEHLQHRGATAIQLGSGGESYFWPGVPVNLAGLVDFYKRQGWAYTHTSVDLIRGLAGYATPASVWERFNSLGYAAQAARSVDIEKLLAFEAAHFPQWQPFFSQKVTAGDTDDILYVADRRGDVVASVLLDSASSTAKGQYWTWRRLLGGQAGAFGVLGVQPDARGQGIGLALAARATELLKERGVATSWVGWTWLIDWYGLLGYRVWQTYWMSHKAVAR